MKKYASLAVYGILIAAISIGVFVVVDNFTKVFWINYISAMLALVVSAVIALLTRGKEKLNLSYNIGLTSWIYIIAALGAALALAFIGPDASFILPFIVHLIIHAGFGIFFIVVFSGNSFIKEQQAVRAQEIMDFKYTLERFRSVQEKIDYSSPYKPLFTKAYDALSSGQTAGSLNDDNGVRTLENSILDSIDALDEAVGSNNAEMIEAKCKEIEKLAIDRQHRLKLRKNF